MTKKLGGKCLSDQTVKNLAGHAINNGPGPHPGIKKYIGQYEVWLKKAGGEKKLSGQIKRHPASHGHLQKSLDTYHCVRRLHALVSR